MVISSNLEIVTFLLQWSCLKQITSGLGVPSPGTSFISVAVCVCNRGKTFCRCFGRAVASLRLRKTLTFRLRKYLAFLIRHNCVN